MNTRIFLLLFVVLGCQNRPAAPMVKSSNGNINTISVVMPDLLWETEVGDAVRAAFAEAAVGNPLVGLVPPAAQERAQGRPARPV